MKLRLSFLALGCWLLCSCAHSSLPEVHTAADLDAAVWRNARQYQHSQLTNHPQQNLDSSSLSFALFFRLPLRERVLVVMDSFARYQTDGESGERMFAMLKDRRKPAAWWETPYPPTAEDEAYTNAIFQTIDSFTEDQLRRFCQVSGDYAMFRKNLKQWKKLCGYKA